MLKYAIYNEVFITRNWLKRFWELARQLRNPQDGLDWGMGSGDRPQVTFPLHQGRVGSDCKAFYLMESSPPRLSKIIYFSCLAFIHHKQVRADLG